MGLAGGSWSFSDEELEAIRKERESAEEYLKFMREAEEQRQAREWAAAVARLAVAAKLRRTIEGECDHLEDKPCL